jgi:hypothetical protein
MDLVTGFVVAALCTPHFNERVLVKRIAVEMVPVVAAATVLTSFKLPQGETWTVVFKKQPGSDAPEYRVISNRRPPPAGRLDVSYYLPDLGCETPVG